MKLISLTDFVINEWSIDLTIESRKRIYNYAKFLKQPLTLGMFVPCDEDGNILEEPNKQDYIFEHHPELTGNPKEYDEEKYQNDCLEWILAKEKVLLVFDFNNPHHLMESYNTIEDLANFYSPLLTESAIKQIGLK